MYTQKRRTHICVCVLVRKNMNSTMFPTEFSTSHNDTLPPCRAAFYQDRVFDLDRLGQGRIEGFNLRLDFFKPGL